MYLKLAVCLKMVIFKNNEERNVAFSFRFVCVEYLSPGDYIVHCDMWL